MTRPLVLTDLLRRAGELFADKQIVQYGDGAPAYRYAYRDYNDRVLRLAGALRELGVRTGDRVATLAWNTHRHLELYFAIPLAGAVLHTVDLRLEPDDIRYILDHADDQVVVADTSLLPALGPARAARPQMLVVGADVAAPERVIVVDALPAPASGRSTRGPCGTGWPAPPRQGRCGEGRAAVPGDGAPVACASAASRARRSRVPRSYPRKPHAAVPGAFAHGARGAARGAAAVGQ